jgi:hypothetical protein
MTADDVIDLVRDVFDTEIERCNEIMRSHEPPYTVGLFAVIVNMEDMKAEILERANKNAGNGSGQNDRNVLR